MLRALRLVGWLLLLFVVLLIVALAILRFRPEAAVWAANGTLSDVQITTDGLQLRYFPPTLRLNSANIVLPDQTIDLNTVAATFNASAWRSDAPFWSVTAEAVAIDVTAPSSATEVTTAPTNVAVPNLAPFFSFTRLGVKQLTMTGDTPLSASFNAERTNADTVLDMRLDQGGASYTLKGTITSEAAQPLAFTFELAGGAELTASLAGTLAHNGGTTLTITNGEATLGEQDDALTLAAISGVVTIPGAGDKVNFDNVTTTIISPARGINNLPATLRGSATFGAQALNVAADGTVDTNEMTLALAIANATGALSGKIDVQSAGLPEGIEHSPFAKADLFPATLSSRFSSENEQIELTEFNLDTPRNALQGSLSVSTGETLVLIADFTAARLFYPLVSDGETSKTDAATDSPAAPETNSEQPADPSRLFTDAPIDWSWLSTATIDAKLVADTLALQDAEFKDLAIQLHNKNNELLLEPFSATLADGGFNGSLKVALQQVSTESAAELEQAESSTTAAPVDVTAAFELTGVALEAFGLVSKEELSGGQVEAVISLTTKGNTTAQLAAGLNGDILMLVEEATLMNDFVEVIGSDIVMETLNKLNPFAKSDPTTELSCALVHFSAEDGKLTTKNELVMETTKMEIVGTGNIDLNTEKLSIGITPNAKSGVGINIGSAVKFLKLGGTLSAPRPAVSAGGLLKSGLAIGAAISTGGASVVAEGLAKRALNAGSACAAARQKAGLTEEDIKDTAAEGANNSAAEKPSADTPS